jgi:SAM-dependent methyltransferase
LVFLAPVSIDQYGPVRRHAPFEKVKIVFAHETTPESTRTETRAAGDLMSVRRVRSLAKTWETLGEADPLFGVLSDPDKWGGKWDVDEFYASGAAHVQKLLRTLDDARATYARDACLDFGCGVGRLTFPLADSFARTVGVDVARPMIDAARRHLRAGDRCEFILNRDPDLRQFPDATFDLVHSCLVLQHMPPDLSLRYIGEFFRVCRPGGLVVFQLPAETRSAEVVSATHALPETAFAARIEVQRPPASLESSASQMLHILLTNQSSVAWPHDIPAGRHVCLGNHWLREDGTMAIQDDGRAFLPATVDPGATVEVALKVQAPSDPGDYMLELDLVQEHVCWFGEKGSPRARVAIRVIGAPDGGRLEPVGEPATDSDTRVTRRASRRWSPLNWIRSRAPGPGQPFEMHVVPRDDVERTIRSSEGTLLRAVDDNAAGPSWLSYTYICRRGTASASARR